MSRATNDHALTALSADRFLGASDRTVQLAVAAAVALVVWTGTDANEGKAGGAGNDTLNGGGGNDILRGLDGNDVLEGGTGDDELDGAAGDDTLSGSDGNDDLYGHAGNDLLLGGAGDDNLWGEAGNDTLDSGLGNFDYLTGGTGDDVYYVRHSRANIFEEIGRGNDTVVVFVAEFSVGASASVEVIKAADGLSFGQKLVGSNYANTMLGGNYNDTLDGGLGDDAFFGGLGDDVYHVQSAGDTVHEAAGGGIDKVVASLDYTLADNVENLEAASGKKVVQLTGNSLANNILGNNFGNRLTGFSGNDMLSGGGGQDTLVGGLGNDVLQGGSGADIFIFDNKPKKSNRDRVLDFNVAEDFMFLENKVFKALGKKGSEKKPYMLKKDAFYIGTKAKDAEDRIVYNKKNGVLYYDPDGVGGKSQIYIAKLTKKLKLKYHDFYII